MCSHLSNIFGGARGVTVRKWSRWLKFKTWMILFVFHMALITLRKVWIQLISLQLSVNTWLFNLGMVTGLGERNSELNPVKLRLKLTFCSEGLGKCICTKFIISRRFRANFKKTIRKSVSVHFDGNFKRNTGLCKYNSFHTRLTLCFYIFSSLLNLSEQSLRIWRAFFFRYDEKERKEERKKKEKEGAYEWLMMSEVKEFYKKNAFSNKAGIPGCCDNYKLSCKGTRERETRGFYLAGHGLEAEFLLSVSPLVHIGLVSCKEI